MKRYKPGDKVYVTLLSEGDMIHGYRNPCILYAEVTKGGYRVLEHIYGVASTWDYLKVKIGTGHYFNSYTPIFDTKEQAYDWVKKYWKELLEQLDSTKQNVQNLLTILNENI